MPAPPEKFPAPAPDASCAEPPQPDSLVYIVDDDEAIRDSLSWLLSSRHLNVYCYASAESFLANTTPDVAGCLVLDVRMEGMSGLGLFESMRQQGYSLPVVFLSGHGDVPMAVMALKHGAFDFVEKPFNNNELVNRVMEAMRSDRIQRQALCRRKSLQTQLDSLSKRETQVMELVLAGKLNKLIAAELNISMRTVEVHRASVFEKMGVRTAVELAARLQDAS